MIDDRARLRRHFLPERDDRVHGWSIDIGIRQQMHEPSRLHVRKRHAIKNLRNAETGEIAAACELTAVHTDRKTRKSVPFAPVIRNAALRYLNSDEVVPA